MIIETCGAAMFVHLTNGGVLELFRLHRAPARWRRPAARALLFRFRRDQDAVIVLRRFLSERRRSSVVSFLSDDALLNFAADLICSGSLVVLAERASYRWGGASAVLGGPAGIALLWRDGLAGLVDPAWAAGCLAAIDKESSPLRSLEELLPQWMFDPQERLSESELLRLLHLAIQAGEIAASYHWPNGRTAPVPESPQYVAPAAAQATPAAEEPETNTFDSEHQPGTQAGVLRGAAQAGTPFCEVCQRRAAGR